jgi:uncharacterized membrane protein (UPF0136 family)
MKTIAWGAFFVLAVGIVLSVRQGLWEPSTAAGVALAIFFGVHPIGAAWMLYQVVRYERKPFPLILVVLVPYAFVWYYLERVKTGKQSLRNHDRTRSSEQV